MAEAVEAVLTPAAVEHCRRRQLDPDAALRFRVRPEPLEGYSHNPLFPFEGHVEARCDSSQVAEVQGRVERECKADKLSKI